MTIFQLCASPPPLPPLLQMPNPNPKLSNPNPNHAPNRMRTPPYCRCRPVWQAGNARRKTRALYSTRTGCGSTMWVVLPTVTLETPGRSPPPPHPHLCYQHTTCGPWVATSHCSRWWQLLPPPRRAVCPWCPHHSTRTSACLDLPNVTCGTVPLQGCQAVSRPCHMCLQLCPGCGRLRQDLRHGLLSSLSINHTP
jgi:hypothetical protein